MLHIYIYDISRLRVKWNFPFDTFVFGPDIVPVLSHMRWLSGTVSQGKMSSEILVRRAEFKGQCNSIVIHPYTVVCYVEV